MDKFKEFEEYATLMTTQYDAGYDLGVEEIFFNIWRKCRDFDYMFFGERAQETYGEVD